MRRRGFFRLLAAPLLALAGKASKAGTPHAPSSCECEKLREAVIWMSGSEDFGPEGKAHQGWAWIRESLL